MKIIMKCLKCGKYTLKDKCFFCGEDTLTPKPAKFSPDDKYGIYRRKAKINTYRKEGLL